MTFLKNYKNQFKYEYRSYSNIDGGNPFVVYPPSIVYSLRKVIGSATKCVRVLRSSDNTEQDFGFVGIYLDTASLLTFVGAGNGFITKWYDQSGNGLDAVQTLASFRPKIVNAGSLYLLNGKNAISFNDTGTPQSNFLITANSFLAANPSGLWQFFGVGSYTFDVGGFFSGDDNGGGKRLGQFTKLNVIPQTIAFNSANAAFTDSANAIVLGNQYLMYSLRTANSVEAFVNNVGNGSTVTTGTPKYTNPRCLVGGLVTTTTAFNMRGFVQEIIQFPDNNPVRIPVSANINSFYSIY